MVNALLVEDNLFFRQSLKQILKARFPELDILEAGDGQEALHCSSQTPPDLVFLDISLPLLNGLEVCKSIRQENPETVIVILTNYDLPEYRQAASKNGADYFFSKDTRQEEILVMVDSELSKKGGRPGKGP